MNLLGLTPLDFSDNENAADLRAFLEEEGWHVQCSFMMGASLEDIAAASEAEVNLVVSQSGMGLARTMWRRWQIPYVAGTLAGTDRRPLSHRIQTACATGVCSPAGAHFPEPGGVLVVGDQVLANSIRERLNTQYGVRGVTVGTFFGLDRELAQPFDLDIPSEAALVELIQSGRYQVLVGDPLLQEIPGSDRLACFSVPHVAVSSKLYWHDYLRFASPEMEQLLAADRRRGPDAGIAAAHTSGARGAIPRPLKCAIHMFKQGGNYEKNHQYPVVSHAGPGASGRMQHTRSGRGEPLPRPVPLCVLRGRCGHRALHRQLRL